MPKGKKTDPETVYKVLVSYAVTNNYKETARLLGVPQSTVEKLVKDNKDKPEFVKVCAEKKNDFTKKASDLIDKGLQLLSRRLDTAIEHEDALDVLIDEIYDTNKEELSQDEKNRLVAKIRTLQVQKMGDITTAIGTLYDKRALANGESTANESIRIEVSYE